MKSILIVDDKTENLYLLQALLQGKGYRVQTAANGEEALAAARAEAPDLVITDILMPVMDGFTLCREWRQDASLAPIPFVFYTATYTEKHDEEFALGLGADLFLVKPMEPDAMIAEIERILARGPSSRRTPAAGAAQSDEAYLRQYNEVLVHKLEDKVADMERANAELRALDMMKNTLLMNVTHELRTPLLVVKGYAELIGSGRSGPITETISHQCVAMRNNVDRLLHTISNLIFLADPASAEKTRSVETLDLGEVLEIAIECVRMKAGEKGVEVRREGEPITLKGDRNELLTAVFNLLDNAVKFTPGGGIVTVSTGREAGTARVVVADTGIGIAAEEQQRIFENFYQVDSSTTRRSGGLGLGLGIVRTIAERHGGRIELASATGKGSTFTLILSAG